MKSVFRSFFIRNLLNFIAPLMIPLVVLGLLSVVIIYRYVAQSEASNNISIHQQMHSNMEVLFGELETLYMHTVASALQFNTLQTILNKPTPSLQDLKEFAFIKNFIDSPAVARPYIESIYIYLANDQDRFITSTTGGPMSFEDFYDTGWFDSYLARRDQEQVMVWAEQRSFTKYNLTSFEPSVVSLYQMIDVKGKNDGVIVLNIRLDYLQEQLKPLHTLHGQYLIMGDSEGQIIIQNTPFSSTVTSIDKLVRQPSDYIGPTSFGYAVSVSHSAKYGFEFLSITPKSSVYALPIRLAMITGAAALLSFVLAVILSLLFTRRHVSHIQHIYHLLSDAEKGVSPSMKSDKLDLYHYIIERILVRFLENKYLSTQLTERMARAEVMELSALQAQLNPHFLLNTLESIKWKSVALTDNMNNEVSQMIQHLGVILKSALNYEERTIPFSEELSYAETYITIQKFRYKEKFDVRWHIEPGVEGVPIIKLLLQPLLENSLYHGTRPLQDRPGLIKIKARLDKGHLSLSISDNGVGMSKERLRELRKRLENAEDQSSHIGVFNTQKRLQLFYNEDYEFKLYSKQGQGTLIKIRLPKHPESAP
ncbi:putative sensor-like histidine kinase [compost metagenome]